VLPTCEELGIGFVPWSPLGQGFLTGKIDASTKFESTDFRAVFPRITEEARKANQAVVDLLNQIAGRRNATPAQIALAWLLAQKPWIGTNAATHSFPRPNRYQLVAMQQQLPQIPHLTRRHPDAWKPPFHQ
jgi:aryl-alcohol dehydrogenase-like predicted oxidoreductase